MGKYQIGVQIEGKFYIAALEGHQVKDLQVNKKKSNLVPAIIASDNYALLGPESSDTDEVNVLYVKPLSVEQVTIVIRHNSISHINLKIVAMQYVIMEMQICLY